ncbi:hypothetical protein [Undibacterium danionis]|uniref:Uncharacterized protein n=1 Tax=Undibacterium danionis TaxID=1812100 RepID=A0ABV6ICX7_9BURK
MNNLRLICIVFLFFGNSAPAWCDSVGYAEIKKIQFETSDISIVHWHDWSTKKNRDARWAMISTDKNPFTESNTYSYIQAFDKKTGNILFKSPVPALTVIWATPDSNYIIGISNIKVWNPYHLVVFNKKGDLLYKAAIDTKSYPDASESVTNWINWYKEPVPKITLKSTIDSIEISIESNNMWKQSVINGEFTYGERPNPVPIRIFRFPLKSGDIN